MARDSRRPCWSGSRKSGSVRCRKKHSQSASTVGGVGLDGDGEAGAAPMEVCEGALGEQGIGGDGEAELEGVEHGHDDGADFVGPFGLVAGPHRQAANFLVSRSGTIRSRRSAATRAADPSHASTARQRIRIRLLGWNCCELQRVDWQPLDASRSRVSRRRQPHVAWPAAGRFLHVSLATSTGTRREAGSVSTADVGISHRSGSSVDLANGWLDGVADGSMLDWRGSSFKRIPSRRTQRHTD